MAGKVMHRRRAAGLGRVLPVAAWCALAASGCKSHGSDSATDGSPDALADAGLPGCPSPDAGTLSAAEQDDFGPNAAAAKMTSALGRVNIYEVTNPRLLERVEVYLGTPLAQSRLTIAVHEAASSTTPFRKLVDVQVDVPSCRGWASSGSLAVPLVAGRYYAIGFDPNQVILPYVDSEADDIPVDGRLGRLVGSKTATSVSIASLTWDKVATTEFTRQRLSSSARTETDAGGGDATPGSFNDGGVADSPLRDAAASDTPAGDAPAADPKDASGEAAPGSAKDAALDAMSSG